MYTAKREQSRITRWYTGEMADQIGETATVSRNTFPVFRSLRCSRE